jgi:TetR/AcrR family transcriptional regulator of autoinduction and epiphytic fitness
MGKVVIRSKSATVPPPGPASRVLRGDMMEVLKTERDRDEKRRAILEAARESFAQYGYKATTMDHVAHIANVAKGTIYNFFPSKEELFHVILQDLIRQIEEVATAAIDPALSLFENLHRALVAVLQYRREEELLLRLTREVEDFGTPAAKEALRKFEDAVLGFIERRLRAAIDKGKMKPCDVPVVAFLIYKTYVALLLEWPRDRAPLSNEQIAAVFQQVFAQGLGV